MFKGSAKCSNCGKDIDANEEIYAKMKYPKNKMMIEIKAYLEKNSEIICKKCFEQSNTQLKLHHWK